MARKKREHAGSFINIPFEEIVGKEITTPHVELVNADTRVEVRRAQLRRTGDLGLSNQRHSVHHLSQVGNASEGFRLPGQPQLSKTLSFTNHVTQ